MAVEEIIMLRKEEEVQLLILALLRKLSFQKVIMVVVKSYQKMRKYK
jgi:hypothetical protein